MSDNSNKSSESRYFEDLKNGLDNLNKIIKKVQKIIISSENEFRYYGKPIYVFRGITRFYGNEGNDSKKEKKPNKKKDVENGYIKSSLAVRLKDTSKDFFKDGNYIRATYVNLMEDTIRKAKNKYPQNYPADMSDLDVLADIQHNGGATGLVDFSKNLLTSIWFACNADLQYNGYVYCYNIMEDMITNDALTYIRPEDENKSISELLALTIKERNVSSEYQTRFFIWEPSKKNNRIARQDSVFVFGIGEFKIKDHGIEVIEIPAEQKSSILTAMKAVFNISGNSVYSDYIGFANNLNKLRPYRKMSDSAYSRGYSNMTKGHYSSALEFLKLAELELLQSSESKEESPCEWDNRRVMELHFSIAVCYKKLSRQDNSIKYRENAILEYQKAVKLSKNILEEGKEVGEKAKYYRRKIIRAYDEVIDLQYQLQRYDDAVRTCFELFEIIDKLKNDDKNRYIFISKYYALCIWELRDLAVLKYCQEYKEERGCLNQKIKELIGEVNKEKEKIRKKNTYAYDILENNKNKKSEQSNISLLLKGYYNAVYETIDSELNGSGNKEDIVKSLTEKWRNDATTYFKNSENSESQNPQEKEHKQNTENIGFSFWNFADIKRDIDLIGNRNPLLNIKSKLQDLTAGVISIRDLYEMFDWQKNPKI